MNLGSRDNSNNNNNSSSKEASSRFFDKPFLRSPLRLPPPFDATRGPEFSGEYLKALIKDKDVNGWNYAIFWQASHYDSGHPTLLGWGDGYYNFEIHDQFKCTAPPEEVDRSKKFIQDVLPILDWSPYAFSDNDVTDNLWFFVTSVSKSFCINGVSNRDRIVRGEELWGMMRERAGQGEEDLGLQITVFIPVPDGVLELGSAHLSFYNSDLMNQVIGLLSRIRASWFPRLGYIFHGGAQAIRCSLNVERLVERLPERAENERVNHRHEHNSLERRLAGKEKISEQILEQPWPLLTESSSGDNDITSYSNSMEYSGPS